jgi:hypothetical protein
MTAVRPSRVRLLCAVIAFVAVCLAASGCAADDDLQPVAASTSMVTAMTPPIPLLTPSDVNAAILVGFDPNAAVEQQNDWVQGSELDSELGERLAEVAADNRVRVNVTAVRYVGDGVMDAIADVTVNGKPAQGQVTIPFVADGGRWKLQKTWACQMLASAQLTSPACS